LRTIAVTGLALSVAGGALDFVSGYLLASNSSGMTMTNGAEFLVGSGLLVLGIAELATGAMVVSSLGVGRMRLLGALMEIYGILMGLASAYTPSMNGAMADLMLGVGILMFLNGILMQSWKNGGMKP